MESETTEPEVEETLIDPEIIKRKVEGIAAEWGSLHDEDEAILSVSELPGAADIESFLKVALEKSMEKKEDHIEKTAKLFARLFREGHVTTEMVKPVFSSYNSLLDDVATDVPQIHRYMGRYLSEFLIAGVLTTADLPVVFDAVMEVPNSRVKLLGETLSLVAAHGDDALLEVVNQDEKFQYVDYFSPKKRTPVDIQAWISKYKLSALDPVQSQINKLEAGLKSGGSLDSWLSVGFFPFYLAINRVEPSCRHSVLP
jgi:hypothetical protein